MYVLLIDQKVSDCSFQGEGCAICIATASLVTEHAKGKTVHEVMQWGTREIFDFLEAEIGAVRIKCALLPLEVLHEALKRVK